MKSYRDLILEVRTLIREVSVDAVKAALDEGRPAAIIDIREQDEIRRQGRIPGALSIPRGILESRIERDVPDRDREIIVYCAGGANSVLAARSLQEMGYRNVSSMSGGYYVWEAAKYPTEKPNA
ncbi:MAG: rhodanese-like domain-containing protein [Planctomycetota bacterium]